MITGFLAKCTLTTSNNNNKKEKFFFEHTVNTALLATGDTTVSKTDNPCLQ